MNVLGETQGAQGQNLNKHKIFSTKLGTSGYEISCATPENCGNNSLRFLQYFQLFVVEVAAPPTLPLDLPL